MAAIIQLLLDETVILPKYENQQDREVTKDKMRLALRVAAIHEHLRLVLGALGCGISRNSKEVAYSWLKGLKKIDSNEWLEAIIFVVFDHPRQKASGAGNSWIFHDILDGTEL